MPTQSSQKDLPTADILDVPSGYTIGIAPNGKEYIVPQHLLPDLEHAFALYRAKESNKVAMAKPRLSQFENIEYDTLAGGLISYPPDPLFSDQERLAVHAEVLALQELLGILYKDASHRLYMAELEKLKLADKVSKSFINVSMSIKQSLKDIEQKAKQEIKDDGREGYQGVEGSEL